MIDNKIQLNAQGEIKHLLGLEGLNAQQLLNIINKANSLITNNQLATTTTLKNKYIANLFFEPSTRTRNTFEIAAKRCGANVINIDLENSATKKNETLIDTMRTLEAMQINMFIIRHQVNGMPHQMAKQINNASIINAGDGTNAHPTQALLDMLTIVQYKKNIANLSVAIVGDILHSRVAHSDIYALQELGVSDIRLIAPDNLGQKNYQSNKITCTNNINIGLKDVDVIMILRLQKERMLVSNIPNEAEYFNNYGITEARVLLAKPGVIIMHPGPINREVEIASSVADGNKSLINKQVTNGIAIRMAIMSMLI